MLPLSLSTLRLTLHVLAACVWVGGQITLTALLPVLRQVGDDAPKRAARAFNRVAWPAFAVLVATGVWNLLEVDVGDRSTAYHATLGLKLLVVAASGTAAAVHTTARTKALIAATGAISGIGALAAVLLGVQLGAA